MHIVGEDDDDEDGKSKGSDVRSPEMTGEFIKKIYQKIIVMEPVKICILLYVMNRIN